MNDLPGPNGAWITTCLPKRHHADLDGDVVTQRTPCHGYAYWKTVKAGEPWRPRPRHDHRPLSDPMSSLITDRMPTADDGDMDGDVLAKRRPNAPDYDVTVIHWSYINEGTPWRRTGYWKPKPKRELPGINGQWIRASAVKPTASEADGDGEVEVYRENSDRVHWHGWDSLDNSDLWRPNTHCDKRPLEPAGQRLPGYWMEHTRPDCFSL